ncbi:hypothetical protein Tco_0148630, partial [Tanacetum coccineum]
CGDRNEVVALSAFLRFLEYSSNGPLMKAASALSAWLQPGVHARARRALLPFSDSSSNIIVSEGHFDKSPRKKIAQVVQSEHLY